MVYEIPPATVSPGQRTLQENLRRLRSPDMGTRARAFGQIRPLPKPQIKAAYQEVRQITPPPGWQLDCLERLEVEIPDPPLVFDRCICTVISPGYEMMLEALLSTLACYGESLETHVVVFAVDGSYDAMAYRQDITCVRCRSVERLSPAVKGVLYSATEFIQARQIVALEADMLVVGSLQPLWALMEVTRPDRLLGARITPARRRDRVMLAANLRRMNAGVGDMKFLTDEAGFDAPFWFNGGVIAGGHAAFACLHAQMRRLAPYSILWMEGGSAVSFTDEFLMNLCIGLLNNAVELEETFNQQFYNLRREQWVHTLQAPEGPRYSQEGVPSRILHFVSPARPLMWQIEDELREARE